MLGKATILVPSPNVAEDHQTKNAMALYKRQATVLIKDSEAKEKLISKALATVNSPEKLEQLKINATQMALPNSDELIVDELIKIIK